MSLAEMSHFLGRPVFSCSLQDSLSASGRGDYLLAAMRTVNAGVIDYLACHLFRLGQRRLRVPAAHQWLILVL
jgi:hypothetical protein